MRVKDVGESESRIITMRTAAHASARKGADFRQVADHGKDYERFHRSLHGQTTVRPLTALRAGNRRLSTNPYRKVGEEIFRRRMLHGVLSLREPCAGKLARTVLGGRGSSDTPLLPYTAGA